jgi:hypothetical protein
LVNSGLGLVPYATFIDNSQNSEFGLSFKPLVKGKINSFILKIPQGNNIIRVTLWDKASRAVITTENIEVKATDRDVTVIKSITPISLEKDKEYVVSFNTNDSYYYIKNSGGITTNVAYNITCNNILVTDFLLESNVTFQTFPTNSDGNANFYGNLSFNFQQTE